MIPPYKPFSSEGWQVDASQIIRKFQQGSMIVEEIIFRTTSQNKFGGIHHNFALTKTFTQMSYGMA